MWRDGSRAGGVLAFLLMHDGFHLLNGLLLFLSLIHHFPQNLEVMIFSLEFCAGIKFMQTGSLPTAPYTPMMHPIHTIAISCELGNTWILHACAASMYWVLDRMY